VQAKDQRLANFVGVFDMKYSRWFPILIAAIIGVFVMLACDAKRTAGETPATDQGPKSQPTPRPKSDPITIAAVGDIMLGSPYPNDSRMPPNDGADLLSEVTPILSAADIAFGNLEGPMVDTGKSAKCSPGSTRCFAFRVPTRYGKYLKTAGFDVMSVANNHAGDFGDEGRASTRRVLDEQGIKHVGSDRERFSTAYLEIKGKKVAVIGFAHNNIVPNVNDLGAARQYVIEAKKKADIVIVSFHGGAEGTSQQHVPNRTEIFAGEARGNLPAFAHAVIDAGADLVLGHGPHVMRGMEIYKGHLIVYSLGNFCTYGWFQLVAETALTEIVEVTIDSKGLFIGGKIRAGKQSGRGGPVLDPSGEAIKVVRNLSTTDFGLNAPKITDDGAISPLK
jgi:poly-gamma-glutamate capsule biosynthesis protein CapA/YwtB (metallophosphatase superfamily)